MRAVIDEGVSRRLATALRALGRDVSNFPKAWKGLKNGQLLARVEATGFGVLVTCDKNLSFQQNIARSSVALIVLPAQHFDELAPLVAGIDAAETGKVSSVVSDKVKGFEGQ